MTRRDKPKIKYHKKSTTVSYRNSLKVGVKGDLLILPCFSFCCALSLKFTVKNSEKLREVLKMKKEISVEMTEVEEGGTKTDEGMTEEGKMGNEGGTMVEKWGNRLVIVGMEDVGKGEGPTAK